MALTSLTRTLGIHSAGTSVTSELIHTLNFVGAGNSLTYNDGTIDINIAGSGSGAGGGGGASKIISGTVFAYQNVITEDTDIELPNKTALIYADPDVTVDIEPGVTVSIDATCFLNIVDI